MLLDGVRSPRDRTLVTGSVLRDVLSLTLKGATAPVVTGNLFHAMRGEAVELRATKDAVISGNLFLDGVDGNAIRVTNASTGTVIADNRIFRAGRLASPRNLDAVVNELTGILKIAYRPRVARLLASIELRRGRAASAVKLLETLIGRDGATAETLIELGLARQAAGEALPGTVEALARGVHHHVPSRLVEAPPALVAGAR